MLPHRPIPALESPQVTRLSVTGFNIRATPFMNGWRGSERQQVELRRELVIFVFGAFRIRSREKAMAETSQRCLQS